MSDNINVNQSEQPYEMDAYQPAVDVLNREGIVNQLFRLLEILSNNRSSCTFALNGAWGTGKTFVLNMLEEDLVSYKDGNQFLVFHYNCWKYDYYQEPLIAIVSAMLDGVDEDNPLLSTETKQKVKASMKAVKPIIKAMGLSFLKNKIGIDAEEVVKTCEELKSDYNQMLEEEKEQYNYDEYLQFNESLKNARKALEKLTEDKTLVVVVDELDRCLPTYAITVLERLHHLFDGVNNCEVLLSVDAEQLKYTVKNVFGEPTKPEEYLKKFIDFTVELDSGKIEGDIQEKYNDYFNQFDSIVIKEDFDFNEFFQTIFFGIDIRTQEKIVNKANTIHRLLFNDKCDYSVLCIELLIVLFKDYYKIDQKYFAHFIDPILLYDYYQKSELNNQEQIIDKCRNTPLIDYLDYIVEKSYAIKVDIHLFNKLKNLKKWILYFVNNSRLNIDIMIKQFHDIEGIVNYNDNQRKNVFLYYLKKCMKEDNYSSMIEMIYKQFYLITKHVKESEFSFSLAVSQEDYEELSKDLAGLKQFIELVNTIH